jgi:hypothetical protein
MKKLTLKDFEVLQFMGLQFYSHNNGKHEIMIEPCFNGFDISVYNLNEDLVTPQICLGKYIKREKGRGSIRNWEKTNKLQLAIDVANETYQEFIRTHGG